MLLTKKLKLFSAKKSKKRSAREKQLKVKTITFEMNKKLILIKKKKKKV